MKLFILCLTLMVTPSLATSPTYRTVDERIIELKKLQIDNMVQLDQIKFKLKYETSDSFYKNPDLKDSILDKGAPRPVL